MTNNIRNYFSNDGLRNCIKLKIKSYFFKYKCREVQYLVQTKNSMILHVVQ